MEAFLKAPFFDEGEKDGVDSRGMPSRCVAIFIQRVCLWTFAGSPIEVEEVVLESDGIPSEPRYGVDVPDHW